MVDLVKQIMELALAPIHSLEATVRLKIASQPAVPQELLDATTQRDPVLARSCTMEPNVKIRTVLLPAIMADLAKLIMEPARVLILTLEVIAHQRAARSHVMLRDPLDATMPAERVLARVVFMEHSVRI